jgi:hypothetical protein
MTVGSKANAMWIGASFGYSSHDAFVVTWTVGGTVQTFTAGVANPDFGFILTSDNGAAAPALAVIGLLNPTPGSGTLTMSFTSAPDNITLRAISLIGVNLLGGLAGAFTTAKFGSGTSNSATFPLPAVDGGFQIAMAAGVAGVPQTWNAGSGLPNATAGAAWSAAVTAAATAGNNFALGINSSVFWDAAGVVVNPSNIFPSDTLAVNGNNALAASLVFCVPMLAAGTIKDLVTGKTATTTGGCTTDTTGGYGGGVAFPNGTQDRADFGVWQPLPQGDFTIVVLANPGPTANQNILVGQCDSGVANFACLQANATAASAQDQGWMAGQIFNGVGANGADDGRVFVSGVVSTFPWGEGTMDNTGSLDNGGYSCYAIRISGSAASLWVNGADHTIDAIPVSGIWVNASQHFAIGNLGNFTGGAFSAGCTIVLAEGFNRALTDAEMTSITTNPFQVIK